VIAGCAVGRGGGVVGRGGADVAHAAGRSIGVALVETTKRVVALTFDDGPNGMWTPLVQQRLAQAHVPATFFLIGHDVASRPDLMRADLAAGSEVGDHTYRHPRLTRLIATRARGEI